MSSWRSFEFLNLDSFEGATPSVLYKAGSKPTKMKGKVFITNWNFYEEYFVPFNSLHILFLFPLHFSVVISCYQVHMFKLLLFHEKYEIIKKQLQNNFYSKCWPSLFTKFILLPGNLRITFQKKASRIIDIHLSIHFPTSSKFLKRCSASGCPSMRKGNN